MVFSPLTKIARYLPIDVLRGFRARERMLRFSLNTESWNQKRKNPPDVVPFCVSGQLLH